MLASVAQRQSWLNAKGCLIVFPLLQHRCWERINSSNLKCPSPNHWCCGDSLRESSCRISSKSLEHWISLNFIAHWYSVLKFKGVCCRQAQAKSIYTCGRIDQNHCWATQIDTAYWYILIYIYCKPAYTNQVSKWISTALHEGTVADGAWTFSDTCMLTVLRLLRATWDEDHVEHVMNWLQRLHQFWPSNKDRWQHLHQISSNMSENSRDVLVHAD